MDITSPINLWKNYDILALPLNKSALSQKTENGYTVKEYYFDGYTTVDGRARTYIKIYDCADAKGVVLYLADKSGNVDDELLAKLHDFGYSVAVLDYLGKSDRERYTLYPKSLSACNLDGVEEFTIPDDATSNWYIWACISRRAIKLLQEIYGETHIFALGVGLGGCTVYKLAAFNDGLTACATLLNILPNVVGEGNSLINYRASLDNSAYAPVCEIPMFMALSSNDYDGSLDDMAELAKNTASLKHFRIVERALTCGIKAAYDDLIEFFDERANNVPCEPIPQISPSNSDKNLYINIALNHATEEERDVKVKLYVSFCIEDVPYRNWMNIPIIGLGNDNYMAKINVCQDDKPIYAFANVIYDNKTIRSSNLLGVIPKTIGVRAKPGVSHRKIYDGSMGEDCWTTRDGSAVMPVKGLYDIDGVTSKMGSLLTFKLGDPLFSVPPDTLLQLMLCGEPQTITVSVSNKTNKYECTVNITDDSDWHKFSLSHMNFKGAAGMLSDWSQILVLEFTSDKQFILGSVIWV
ncbi:MAG: hypothetical protein K2M47_02055 [Clostridiales bacterium]|nr:hypothetical protein [Clostridiales bacterium]